MARRKQRPARRQPPTSVEIAARDYVPKRRVMLDALPDEALELAEAIADEVALIQRGWSEETEWLRSIGVTSLPQGTTAKKFIEKLRLDSLHRIPPYCRIAPIDRQRFGYSYWLHTTVHVPPERYFWDELTLEEAAFNSRRGRRAFHFALKVASPKRQRE
jgi:hypothetical protein